jgi:hypothetical protein
MGDYRRGRVVEEFQKDLEALINKHGIENEVDMPDFLLAALLCRVIAAIGKPIKEALDWHGGNSVCHPKPVEDDIL